MTWRLMLGSSSGGITQTSSGLQSGLFGWILEGAINSWTHDYGLEE